MSILDSHITPPLTLLAIAAVLFLVARHLLRTLAFILLAQLVLLVLFPSLLVQLATAVDYLRHLVNLA